VTSGLADRPALSPAAVTRATALLIALRVGYAYNWFDVGPALPAIGAEFSVGIADWGLLIAFFLVGAGLFQIPAGFLARRFGSRSVSLAGTALLAVGGVGGALAPDFPVLLALRLLAGVGAGLFFSPAIGLVASLYPEGRRGLPVGTFSSAFSAGAAFGLLGSSALVPVLGWRWSLAVGGVLLGAVTLAAFLGIPRAAGAPPPLPSRPGLPAALRFRGTWVIGAAFIGLEGASFATGQFIVPYGETVLGWSALLAGGVGIAFVFPSVVGGPVGGWFAERRPNHRTQFVGATVVVAGVLLALPFVGWPGAVAIGAVFSFGYGVIYAVMYVLPHYWPRVPAPEIPLAIGAFNSIQLAGGAVVSAVFAWVVAGHGYSVGWWFLAASVVVFLAALAALPRSVGGRPPGGASAAPPPAPAR
jgi:predicted MFS family arabinose efflux permease